GPQDREFPINGSVCDRRRLAAFDVLGDERAGDTGGPASGKETLEWNEPRVRFAQVSASGRLVMSPEILQELIDEHPRDLREHGLPQFDPAFAFFQERLGRAFLVTAGTLPQRPAIHVEFDPENLSAFVDHTHTDLLG